MNTTPYMHREKSSDSGTISKRKKYNCLNFRYFSYLYPLNNQVWLVSILHNALLRFYAAGLPIVKIDIKINLFVCPVNPLQKE